MRKSNKITNCKKHSRPPGLRSRCVSLQSASNRKKASHQFFSDMTLMMNYILLRRPEHRHLGQVDFK